MKNIFLKLFLIAFSLAVLFAGVRGLYGNPTAEELNTKEWKDDGPLELSPERGRYALLYSMVEDKSFYFSLPVARFATPDLGYKNGHFVSLFAPAVSFVAAPGYLIGKIFNLSQVGSFLTVSIFAAANVVLIYLISVRCGANKYAAGIASLIFLFATPAFAYAVSLYQHHISSFSVLLGLWLLLSYNSWLSLFLIWFLCALSIPIDYPNLFFMLPIGIAALGKFINFMENKNKFLVKINFKLATSLTGLLLPLAFFMWFNFSSYGNPLQFSGTVASVEDINDAGVPRIPEKYETGDFSKVKKSSLTFFQSRDLVQLGYIHLFSPDRGVLVYAPLMFLGIFGAAILNKYNGKFTSIMLTVVSLNVVLYSMFGEGGWAFGSRYLIPSYAVMSIFLSLTLSNLRTKKILLIIILIMTIYSVAVNTLGALTTNRIPPKVEAIELEKVTGRVEHYTYLRNWEYINTGNLKSYVFRSWAHDYVSSLQYFYIVMGSISLVITILIIMLARSPK